MTLSLRLLSILICFCFCTSLNAQIEADHLSMKGFAATGFGGFLNVSVPVSEANFVTGEFGIGVFSHQDDNVAILPVLIGYRYTLDQTGTGFYLEPNAGYTFGGSDIQKYDQYDSPVFADGKYVNQKVSGATAGLGFGYLFEPGGRIQFNIGLRYEHIFAEAGENLFSLRIAHAFTIGRRDR